MLIRDRLFSRPIIGALKGARLPGFLGLLMYTQANPLDSFSHAAFLAHELAFALRARLRLGFDAFMASSLALSFSI